PAVGMFFAELGANVIKIENKNTNGDVTRTWKLASEDANTPSSAYFNSVNYNKQHLFIDLTNDTEKSQVLELIKTADILISNYKPGDDVKLGLDYDTIKKINPTIIYAHLSGFGNNSKRTAFDLVLQAETGFMYMNGTKESGPLKMPVALIDVLAAHQLKEAILVALIQKLKTNQGCKIAVSLYDAAVASLANQASNWLNANHNPEAIGSLHPNIAPYGELFNTADDKKIVLAIGNDKQFKKLCELIHLNQLVENPLFSTNTNRVKNRKELFKLLESKISDFTSNDLIQQFIKNDVPAGIIKSVKEVFEQTENEALILTDENGKRVKTTAFDIQF
ncbi:MAG: CoA transferase, partial [Bacteroidia bacterium]|nr:CoA transferase [Bacteroidia bacterium]